MGISTSIFAAATRCPAGTVPFDLCAGIVTTPAMGGGEGQAAMHAKPAAAETIKQASRVDAVPSPQHDMFRRDKHLDRRFQQHQWIFRIINSIKRQPEAALREGHVEAPREQQLAVPVARPPARHVPVLGEPRVAVVHVGVLHVLEDGGEESERPIVPQGNGRRRRPSLLRGRWVLAPVLLQEVIEDPDEGVGVALVAAEPEPAAEVARRAPVHEFAEGADLGLGVGDHPLVVTIDFGLCGGIGGIKELVREEGQIDQHDHLGRERMAGGAAHLLAE
mmetsp:Transcript_20959/g.44845  ORF Transcript_20959/g.44845 Transcript_20959/m.44845 type:complete len:277 (+) Transcript_20959:197-1027(+)